MYYLFVFFMGGNEVAWWRYIMTPHEGFSSVNHISPRMMTPLVKFSSAIFVSKNKDSQLIGIVNMIINY